MNIKATGWIKEQYDDVGKTRCLEEDHLSSLEILHCNLTESFNSSMENMLHLHTSGIETAKYITFFQNYH